MLAMPPGIHGARALSTAKAFVVLLVVGAAGAASCGSGTALKPDGAAAGTSGAGGSATAGVGSAAAGAGGGAVGGSGGGVGTAQDGGADAAAGSTKVDAAVMYTPACPKNPAAATGTCTPFQVCEYRAPNARPPCVTRLLCNDPGTGAKPSWQITPPDPTCGTRSASCPSTYSAVAQGSLCPMPRTASCSYDEGQCDCYPCSWASGTGGQGIWLCRAWDTGGPGCPPVAPLSGTACKEPDLFCMYSGPCDVAVGEDHQCTGGFWKQLNSVAGSCVILTCPSTPADVGVNHPPDTCAQASDCPGGACWRGLDGAKSCVEPAPAPTLNSCQAADTTCCRSDSDCAQPTNGRCLPSPDAEERACGAAVPLGNVCRDDQCGTDADCLAREPGVAPLAACLPSGAFGLFSATCAYGICRTDADCVLHAGGKCQYGWAATGGFCSFHYGSILPGVLFCAYPSDPCQVAHNASTECPPGKICVPSGGGQGQECGLPPPVYP